MKRKTKEITTMKEVWKCDLNYHKIWWTFDLNFSNNYRWFEKAYQTLQRLFHLFPKHLLKELGCTSFFSPLLGVCKPYEKTSLFLVFGILLKTPSNNFTIIIIVTYACSDAVLHMSWNEFNELSSCEVQRLNQFRMADLILIGSAIFPDWLSRE